MTNKPTLPNLLCLFSEKIWARFPNANISCDPKGLVGIVSFKATVRGDSEAYHDATHDFAMYEIEQMVAWHSCCSMGFERIADELHEKFEAHENAVSRLAELEVECLRLRGLVNQGAT